MSLLIFDCDGVLVDSEILHAQVESEIGRELGIARDALAHSRLFAGTGLKNVYRTWERETGQPLSPNLDSELKYRKDLAFAHELKALPHIADALVALASFKRCVATGSPLQTLKTMLRSTDLYEAFAPHLFTTEKVARGKPAPDIFLYAAQHMDAEPQDCLVIEDSIHGVHAAIAAGMPVIGFTGASHCQPDHGDNLRKAGASHIIHDMGELPAVVQRHFVTTDMRVRLSSLPHQPA